MHYGRWLKEEISRQKKTISAFASKVGISRSRLNEWFTQESPVMRRDMVWMVLEALGLEEAAKETGNLPETRPDSADPLNDRFYPAGVFQSVVAWQRRPNGRQPLATEPSVALREDPEPNVDQYSERAVAEIPLFELSLSAGPWSDVLDVPGVDAEVAIRGLFRVRISGESMAPKYRTGSIVEFECLRDGYHELAAGRDYYVQRSDGTATFKRMEGIEETSLVLRAINKKKFPKPLVVDRAEIVRMAVARWILTSAAE